jgi:HEAT repeat protein
MNQLERLLISTMAIAALSLGSAAALAQGGLAAQPAQLPAAARAALTQEIEAYRLVHPELFRAVLDVEGVRPEVYTTFRNPLPNAAPELRALGQAGLLPMLSALLIEGPRRALSDRERNALTSGMLEAVGRLRDPRSAPVLRAALEGTSKDPVVRRAAAEALGRLCGDADLALLIKHSAAGDELREASIHGLGQCKRVESAQHLASILDGAADDATAAAAVGALGLVGSSWAWKAMGPAAQPTGLAVREIAAHALVKAFALRGGEVRARIGKSMLEVEHPILPELIEKARASAQPELQVAFETLQKQLARQLVR